MGMKVDYPVVLINRRSGRYYAYLVGRPDYHIMDWRGCNYHIVRIKEQPSKGFSTADEASEWGEIFARGRDYYDTLGTFFSDQIQERWIK